MSSDPITELCCGVFCLFCASFCGTMCIDACCGHINKVEISQNQSPIRNQAYSINHDNDVCHERSWNYNPNRFSNEPSAPTQDIVFSSNPVGTEVITTQPHRSDSEIIFGITTPKIEDVNSPPPLYGSWFQINDSRNESPKY
ncbi:unnamed protein product [Chironomus riparius]|uniref:Secreted protein n=1 Tax=Chironomus riparius TaxID=315576 RepID=A0A9N9RXC5_9DIPT|nr:unnamed protein product [Chironomus riparius]